MQLRPLWRAALGHGVYRAARASERADVVLPHPTLGQATWAASASIDLPYWRSAPNIPTDVISLGQYRWDPVPHAGNAPLTWLTGMRTMTTAGDVNTQTGMAAHVYLVTASMEDAYFYSADSANFWWCRSRAGCRFCHGTGSPRYRSAGHRAAAARAGLSGRGGWRDRARGFVCENYGQTFTLPDRGPIGANCLANPRDFKTPVAAFEDREVASTVTVKWCGQFHETAASAIPRWTWWRGMATTRRCKYDLTTYCPVGAILFDHPDPSIFTVLTAASGVPGTANIDFVLVPRTLDGGGEYVPAALVPQERDVGADGQHLRAVRCQTAGLRARWASACTTACCRTGPTVTRSRERLAVQTCKPHKLDNTMSFMFETRFPQHLTRVCRARRRRLQDNYIVVLGNVVGKASSTEHPEKNDVCGRRHCQGIGTTPIACTATGGVSDETGDT